MGGGPFDEVGKKTGVLASADAA